METNESALINSLLTQYRLKAVNGPVAYSNDMDDPRGGEWFTARVKLRDYERQSLEKMGGGPRKLSTMIRRSVRRFLGEPEFMKNELDELALSNKNLYQILVVVERLLSSEKVTKIDANELESFLKDLSVHKNKVEQLLGKALRGDYVSR